MANRIMLNENILSRSRSNQGDCKQKQKQEHLRKHFVCSDPDLIKFGVNKKGNRCIR